MITVHTSSHQLRMNGLRNMKAPDLPLLSGGCRANPINVTKSVINYTVLFKLPGADGLILRFTATRPRLWRFNEWGSFSCRSSAWWYLSTEGNSASTVKNKTSPFLSGAFVSRFNVPSAGQLPNPSAKSSSAEGAFAESGPTPRILLPSKTKRNAGEIAIPLPCLAAQIPLNAAFTHTWPAIVW